MYLSFSEINSYKLDESTANSNSPILYFCSAGNGKLYKATLNGIGSPIPSSITRLNIPNSLRCDGGRSLEIIALTAADGITKTKYLAFPYNENGLAAVGGYKIQ